MHLDLIACKEAKHIKPVDYVQNTCNFKKNQSWWKVFRHECLYGVDMRTRSPQHYLQPRKQEKACDSYIPKRVAEKNVFHCHLWIMYKTLVTLTKIRVGGRFLGMNMSLWCGYENKIPTALPTTQKTRKSL